MRRPQQELEAAKSEVSRQFGELPGVEGVGIGEDQIRVYVRNSEVRGQLPEHVAGIPLDVVVTGDISTEW